jgi:hypothetical protein
MGHKRTLLGMTGRALLLAGIATQFISVARAWWQFDPRLSCDRMPGWAEWIGCLHGHSHAYLKDTEAALVVWFIAAIAMVLGVFLPPYISAIPPTLAVAVFAWTAVNHWHEAVLPLGPFGQPRTGDVIYFVEWTLIVIAFFVGPVIGAWLRAIDARRDRLELRVPTVK